jgi:hypothetical protein
MKVSGTSGAMMCFFTFYFFFFLPPTSQSLVGMSFLAMRAHHEHGGAVKPCTLFSLFFNLDR